MKKVILVLLTCILIGGLILSVFGCDISQSVREADQEAQVAVLERGQAAEPAYQVQNFLSRQAINEWLKRADTPDKLWYVYLISESGAFIGYFISRTIPLSYGVSLTNPEQYVTGTGTTMTAPGLDAVYYSGTDPSVHYFFDAETDALVTFKTDFVYFDKPLDIDVPRLKIID